MFLEPFQRATLALEKFKSPTLHKVAFWCYTLIHNLKPVYTEIVNDVAVVEVETDFTPIIDLKWILVPIFEETFVLKVIHIVVVLLAPVMNARLPKLNIDNDDIRQGKDALKEFLTRIGDGEEDFTTCMLESPRSRLGNMPRRSSALLQCTTFLIVTMRRIRSISVMVNMRMQPACVSGSIST